MIRYRLFFVLLGWVLSASALSEEAVISKIDAPGISNFSKLETTGDFAGSPVGFGGATAPEAAAWLKAQGFATIINLRSGSEEGVDLEASRLAAAEAGIEYVHIPFSPAEGDLSVIDEFLARTSDRANQPVYIHCGSATRAAALWMIGRVQEDGLTAEEAEGEVRQISGKPDAAIALARSMMANYSK
jgi:uncharacterized protein (TIGR01244 family)